LMLANRNTKPLAAGEIGVNLVVASREVGRPRDLGVMFDYGETDTDNFPREGFAVFTDPHERMPAGRDPELMLTIAHELTHVLNLHHADWEPGQPGGTFDGGSTIESYSTASDVKWAVSERSKQHLLQDPDREKWPGANNLAFGFLLPEHFKRHQSEPADETWSVIEASGLSEKGRHARVAVEQSVRNSPRDRSNVLPPGGAPVLLSLEVPRTTFEVGEPVTLTVELHNTGTEAYHVRPLLDPAYGFLSIDIQLPGSTVFLPFRPALSRQARTVRTEVMQPNAKRHDDAKVFFGGGGWTFQQPGTYLIRADFPAPAPTESAALGAKQRIQSNTLTLEVVAPRTPAGRSAWKVLGDVKTGVDLLVGSASEQLKLAADVGGNSPQAAAARIALVNNVNQSAAIAQQLDVKVDDALAYLAQTASAATGPFAVAQAYDQLAEALEKSGKVREAADVRQLMSVRLSKIEAGPEAARRVATMKR
jgi:hypothetical protein